MDGFDFALICVAIALVVIGLLLKWADYMLDSAFDYDDEFLRASRRAQAELEKRKRIN